MTQITVDTVLKKEDGTVVEPKGCYIMSYDTTTNTVQDYFQFPNGTPLVIMKSTLVNTIETYGAAYINSLGQILHFCKKLHEQQQNNVITKYPITLNPQMHDAMIGRFQMRAEDAYKRLNEWEGWGEFMALLPYCEIATEPNELIGQPPHIDTRNCRPYVNGIYFIMKHVYMKDGDIEA